MNYQMKLAMVRSLLLVFTFGIFINAFAKEIPPAPTNNRWVQDYGNVLDTDQEIHLLRKLQGFYDSTSNEIAIVTERSLEGDDLFRYTHKLAQDWGIGTDGKDNGILIYAAIDDRKIFIQVGKGLEGAVPDAYAKRIIEQIIKPRFRENKYGLGFEEATTALIGLTNGEFKFDKARKSEGIPVWVIILIIIILIAIFSNGGNDRHTYDVPGRRSLRRGGPTIWIGGGGGGGWNGGGGGGFGGGFGGGSFGGGGAGGSW